MNACPQLKTTFLSYEELFNAYLTLSNETTSILVRFSKAINEPYKEVLEKVAQYERKISYILSLALEQKNKDITNTRIQYTLDANLPAPPHTAEQSVRHAIKLNNLIARELNEQVLKTAPESVREVIGAVADQICQYNRRISLVLVTTSDVW